MGDTEVVALRESVERLSLTQRRVLVLHYAEDLTVSEISMVLDVPEVQVREALEELRTLARESVGCPTAVCDEPAASMECSPAFSEPA